MGFNTLSPEEIAEKQIRNLTNNVDSWERGVNRTKKSWQGKTKAAIGKMKARFIKAVDDGLVAEGIDSMSDARMKELTITKGKERIGPGLEAAKDDVIEFHRQQQAMLNSTQGAIDAMSTTTDADADRKMLANTARMRQFRFKKRLRK